MPNARRYITTPIYYVNDRPHIGHVYTTTVCDIWARFQRLLGRDVFFLTGTDEHGQKVEQSAAERGMAPLVFADEISSEFRAAMDLFGLTHDEFIRTTDPQHEQPLGPIGDAPSQQLQHDHSVQRSASVGVHPSTLGYIQCLEARSNSSRAHS